ncbi:MAG TPA: hypothetical protein DCG89_04980 [Spartobacteria bacterium]|jgi:type I restriction enzyme S subunit|nr:hypothetical protein [Spartobacteria bacterium]
MLSGKSAMSPFTPADLASAFPLPWSHYVRLLSVKNPPAREFYHAEALRGGWSVRQLGRQIASQFYERTALSRNKNAMLRKGAVASAADSTSADEEVRDPLVLEFLPIPPLDEQQRIVAEIEKQFTRFEAGVSSLKGAQAALKRYRAGVLKAACDGRLVPTEAEFARKENRSCESADILLRRILKERHKKWNGKGKYKEPFVPMTTNLPTQPEGWTWATIEQLAAPEPNSITDGPFGSNLKTEHYTDSGPRVIRLQNVGDGVYVDEEAHISEAHFRRLQKHRVFADDLVIAAFGENPPRSCVIPPALGPAIVKAACIRFRPHCEIAVKYMNAALNSDPVRKRTKGMVHGVGRPRLNLGEIKSIVLPVPPFAEQLRIVAEVERRLSVIDQLQAIVATNLERATRLGRSILSRAFAGQLSSSV